MLKQFMNDESGGTVIEYGLIGLVSAVAVVSLLTAGGGIRSAFDVSSDALAVGVEATGGRPLNYGLLIPDPT